MKKRFLFGLTAFCMIFLSMFLLGCEKNNTENNNYDDLEGWEEDTYKLVQLKDIYFPDGILDTGLGMFIWNNTSKTWVRTDTEAGKAVFDKTKATTVFAHGMGGNGHSSRPDEYTEMGYNVLNFAWGTFSDEESVVWTYIANKIYFRNENMRWLNNDDVFIEDDIPNVSVAEMYVAYYYDFFSAFPDYSGSEIMIYGHSYGCMLTMAVASCMYSLYEYGELPAYMLPDKINLLDGYFMSFSKDKDVPWLLDKEQPSFGNALEDIYQTALKCRKYGTAVGLFRTDKTVCYPCTGIIDKPVSTSYWKFTNNIVYSHLSDRSRSGIDALHQYGWDWFTDYYYDGQKLTDSSSTTDEEVYYMGMSYGAMFARAGIKYDVYLNGTKDNTDDDVFTSFFCEYNMEINDRRRNESAENLAAYKTGKAKIAGFAYEDKNGNGKFDDRICSHVAGVTVTIKNKDGQTIYSAETEANGYYEVETDVAGEYTITFTAPDGRSVSTQEAKVTVTDVERQLCLTNVIVQ